MLDRKLVRQTFQGYAEVNKITRAEELMWAARLNPEEARTIFEELYHLWEQTGGRAGGNWEALDRLKIAELVRTQRPFVRLAWLMEVTDDSNI